MNGQAYHKNQLRQQFKYRRSMWKRNQQVLSNHKMWDVCMISTVPQPFPDALLCGW
jgi:hypothetical protein